MRHWRALKTCNGVLERKRQTNSRADAAWLNVPEGYTWAVHSASLTFLEIRPRRVIIIIRYFSSQSLSCQESQQILLSSGSGQDARSSAFSSDVDLLRSSTARLEGALEKRTQKSASN